MPKQITVEVTAMAYDAQAAENSRTLQPLTVELEVPVDTDSDAEAILTALAASRSLAALRLGHEDKPGPEPERPAAHPDMDAAVQEMRRLANTPYRRPDYAAVPPGQLLAWADTIEQSLTGCGSCAGGCSC